MDVRDELDERDLTTLRLLADVVAGYIEEREGQRRQYDQRRQRLQAIADDDSLQAVLQPIIELSTETVVGVEALARFPSLGEGPATVSGLSSSSRRSVQPSASSRAA